MFKTVFFASRYQLATVRRQPLLRLAPAGAVGLHEPPAREDGARGRARVHLHSFPQDCYLCVLPSPYAQRSPPRHLIRFCDSHMLFQCRRYVGSQGMQTAAEPGMQAARRAGWQPASLSRSSSRPSTAMCPCLSASTVWTEGPRNYLSEISPRLSLSLSLPLSPS